MLEQDLGCLYSGRLAAGYAVIIFRGCLRSLPVADTIQVRVLCAQSVLRQGVK